MTLEQTELLQELSELKRQMTETYIATLNASTIVLPFNYYTNEQKSLAGIVKEQS